MNYQRHTKLIPSSPEKNPMNSSTRQDGANMHVHKYLILHAQLYVYIYTWLYAYIYLHENNYRPTIKNNMSSNYIIHTKVSARSKKNLGSPKEPLEFTHAEVHELPKKGKASGNKTCTLSLSWLTNQVDPASKAGAKIRNGTLGISRRCFCDVQFEPLNY